jgi:hypothetical protein
MLDQTDAPESPLGIEKAQRTRINEQLGITTNIDVDKVQLALSSLKVVVLGNPHVP